MKSWMALFMQTRAQLISVIIPTLQEEKYIATTLSKLVNVKPRIEIVVVDGGSEDNTIKIAKSFTDKVYEIREMGISKARNYGAKRSNGDILVFLDADVVPPTDFAEKVIETFKDPKVVGATCTIMPTRPKIIERIFFLFFNLLIRISIMLPYAKFNRHSRGEFTAVRRSEFQKVGGFNESIPCAEDFDFACHLSELGKLAFIKNLTVYESIRRIKKLGLLKTVWVWIVNTISYILHGKTILKVWKPVR